MLLRSSESEDEEEEEEADSDEESDDGVWGAKRRKGARPVRRSTRARVSRYDADFINDSDYDDAPRKKKKKQYWSESDSEDSDRSWGRRKRRGRSNIMVKKHKSKKKKSILDELSDVEPSKKKKPKIKYGGLTSSEEDMGKGRRTRGKKTTYVDTLGSDSEEETQRKKNPRRIESDDDEDFVANEEDEKDSEEAQDDLDEEQDEESSGERRPLVVPKIYIKKPPVSKDIEKSREKSTLHPQKDMKEASSNENQESPETPEKISKTKEKPETMENTPQSVQEESQSVQDKEKFKLVEKKLQTTGELPASVEDKSELVEKRQPIEEETKHRGNLLKQGKTKKNPSRKDNADEEEPAVEEEAEDVDEDSNPIEAINKNLDDMDSDEMEKMMEEEEYANKQLQLVAMQIEKEKKRKAQEGAKRLESVDKPAEQPTPVKRGRKPKVKEPVRVTSNIFHEPIVSNVKALIRNDDSNDELSEPPGVTLPLFEELSLRKSEETPKKRRGRGIFLL